VAAVDIDLAINDVELAKATDFAAKLAGFAPRVAIHAIREPIGDFDIVINATPVGMNPGEPSPIPEETVARATIVADIVAAADTPVKRDALRLGKIFVDGEAMIRGQVAFLRSFLLGKADSEVAVLAD
jgi:shikimate dehydrogenase